MTPLAKRLFALCALLIALPAAADEETPPTMSPLGPGAANLFDEFYPVDATYQSVNGHVVMNCVVHLNGRGDCTTEIETPQGWGFGAAGVAISRSFRFTPGVRHGAPVDGMTKRVSFTFAMDDQMDTPPGMPDAARAFFKSLPDLGLPRWSAAPAPVRVREAEPAAFRDTRKRGRAVLSCRVKQDRTLDCNVARQNPQGQGLGDAALVLSREFTVAESSAEFAMAHVAAPFSLPIDFGMDDHYEPLNRYFDGSAPIDLPAPPPQMLRMVYPPEALAAHIGGDVIIACAMTERPPLQCKVDEETPAGHGFAAALMARLVGHEPDLGLMVQGDVVRMHLHFSPDAF